MKVAIIGAGFTGLAAGWELIKNGAHVTIYEASDRPGGLAIGFKDQNWLWGLEKYYHHIFTNDNEIINLANEIGLQPFFKIPETNSFIGGLEKRLDSPVSLLKFDRLSLWARFRMGMGLAFFKLLPNGLPLENFTVGKQLPLIVGREGYEKVWRPLMIAKFGPYADKVNLAWFWARIYKRTTALGYFEGGFQALADKLDEKLKKMGVTRKYKYEVKEIKKVEGNKWKVDKDTFDKVIITTPAPLVDKIIGPKVSWPKIDYLWGQTLVLELNQSLMKGYWLNILERNWPFLVVVEHTNFIDKKYYGGKVLVYLGNYLPANEKRLDLSDEELLKLYLPYLKKINPNFDKTWINRKWRFKAPFAQPVFPTKYSSQIPDLKADEGLFVANMSMVYPWDRGTNYAVELGHKVAKICLER